MSIKEDMQIRIQKVDKKGKPIGKPQHIRQYGFPADATERKM